MFIYEELKPHGGEGFTPDRSHLSHLASGCPGVVHHVQKGVMFSQLLDGHNLLETQTGDGRSEVREEEEQGGRPPSSQLCVLHLMLLNLCV